MTREIRGVDPHVAAGEEPPTELLDGAAESLRSSSGVFSRSGSPKITALPPPQAMPANVALAVIACESRRASSTASSKQG